MCLKKIYLSVTICFLLTSHSLSRIISLLCASLPIDSATISRIAGIRENIWPLLFSYMTKRVCAPQELRRSRWHTFAACWSFRCVNRPASSLYPARAAALPSPRVSRCAQLSCLVIILQSFCPFLSWMDRSACMEALYQRQCICVPRGRRHAPLCVRPHVAWQRRGWLLRSSADLFQSSEFAVGLRPRAFQKGCLR